MQIPRSYYAPLTLRGRDQLPMNPFAHAAPRRIAMVCCAILLALVPASPVRAQAYERTQAYERAQAHDRAQVEAAYVVNFMRYTEWPAAALAAGAPLVVVVHRASATGDAVAAIAAGGTRIGSHPIEVRRTRTKESLEHELAGAHVLYTAGDLDVAIGLAGDFVLTIGRSPTFAAKGGMLALVRLGDRVVFDANLPAIRAAGLSLSAKVLALARHVEGR